MSDRKRTKPDLHGGQNIMDEKRIIDVQLTDKLDYIKVAKLDLEKAVKGGNMAKVTILAAAIAQAENTAEGLRIPGRIEQQLKIQSAFNGADIETLNFMAQKAGFSEAKPNGSFECGKRKEGGKQFRLILLSSFYKE